MNRREIWTQKQVCTFLIAVVLLFALFLVLDYLQNRYVDDLLEQLTVLIEELVGNQEVRIFSELEYRRTSRRGQHSPYFSEGMFPMKKI